MCSCIGYSFLNLINYIEKKVIMKKEDIKNKVHFEKTKKESNDVFNRSFIGTPAIGGMIIMGILILYVIYNMYFSD